MVKLANRIETLKMQEDPENSDMPADSTLAADQSHHASSDANDAGSSAGSSAKGKPSLPKTIKSAIFREVVLAKVREMKQQEQTLKVAEEAEQAAARRKSFRSRKYIGGRAMVQPLSCRVAS